jgi:large subunit ribosomal protein L23
MKDLLIKPIITEKTVSLAKTLNKYTFKVMNSANKIEIADSVAKKFSVKVIDVKTINLLGKSVAFGKKRIKGKRSDTKKAIVTLKSGDNISLFDIK